MVFLGDDSTASPVVRFKRGTPQDLDPFSTGHTSGPARNSNDAERPLKVGKNEIKDF